MSNVSFCVDCTDCFTSGWINELECNLCQGKGYIVTDAGTELLLFLEKMGINPK